MSRFFDLFESRDMKKGKITETLVFPEAMIQHIQSFMSGKEAARSSILSKSWYAAWLTRPTIDLDEQDFPQYAWLDMFGEFAKKTMQRYLDLNLKIEKFRLCAGLHTGYVCSNELIVAAMKIGATSVDLQFSSSLITLPQEVLGSKTLVELSLIKGRVDASNVISCSRLKSLTLKHLHVKSDVFKAIITCCISMEELSLISCTGFALSLTNMYELHKLRRLYLHKIEIDAMFFTDFASRFPCLKDLTVLYCGGYSSIQIASTSLQTIRFESMMTSRDEPTFDVPNIRKFTYLGNGLLSVGGASRELILICCRVDSNSASCMCPTPKEFQTKLRLSRISSFEHDKVVPKPLVVENLTKSAYCLSCCFDLVDLLEICRPKFITHYRPRDKFSYGHTSVNLIYESLMRRVIAPNCGMPEEDMFMKIGLVRVNMEVYELFDDKEWRPVVLKKILDVTETPENKQKVRFELIWD